MMVTPPSQSQSHPLSAILLILLAAATHDYITLVAAGAEQPLITRPGCVDKCGNMTIPFPFGMERGCFLKEGFQVTCNHTFNPPRAFLASKMIYRRTMECYYYYRSDASDPNDRNYTLDYQVQVQLVNISAADSEARVYNAVSSLCVTNNGGSEMFHGNLHIMMTGGEGSFRLSLERNVLIGVGANVEPIFWTTDHSNTTDSEKLYALTSKLLISVLHKPHVLSGRATCISNLMSNTDFATNGTCMGTGCCEAALTPHEAFITEFEVDLEPKGRYPWETYPCSYGMIVEKSWYNFSTVDLVGYETLPRRFPAGVPVVLNFAIGNGPCPANAACASGNSSCADAAGGKGYVCKCLEFYGGNPYIANGCLDIDECALPQLHNCSRGSTCKNRLGGYDCPCNFGLRGDGKQGPCTEGFPLPAKIAVGIAALIVVVVIMVMTHQLVRLKRLYNQNGGQVLEGVKNIRIYSRAKLKQITNNYKQVIGEGHFGKVYKGTIGKEEVAVKKSIKVDKTMREEFIDEVRIQSRMRHKNIVLLQGCCLEMEVPLLVYEFVAKGSLYDVLFKGKDKDISVDTRLMIAHGSAEGLTYMHSAVENTIRHGDVKSANILLDKEFNPKVADFGTSKLMVRGRDEKADLVTGDMAYIDPEYMLNGTVTQKSDVYSFGIVLIELITRRHATYDEERSYVASFVQATLEKRARELFDNDVTSEADIELLETLSEIVVECVKPKPEERLEMKQVEHRLYQIKGQSA